MPALTAAKPAPPRRRGKPSPFAAHEVHAARTILLRGAPVTDNKTFDDRRQARGRAEALRSALVRAGVVRENIQIRTYWEGESWRWQVKLQTKK